MSVNFPAKVMIFPEKNAIVYYFFSCFFVTAYVKKIYLCSQLFLKKLYVMELIEVWQIWLIVAVVFFIVEIFTTTFVFLCFSLGCILASVFAGFGLGLGWQLLAFSVITVVSFFTVRPFMIKYAYRKSEKIKTNVDALVGSKGRVTEIINVGKNTGRVLVNGDDWKAESENGEIIQENEQIEVKEVNSTILIVKQINKKEEEK
jgi:membrane protein implicated in regulation of membrane protease activity